MGTGWKAAGLPGVENISTSEATKPNVMKAMHTADKKCECGCKQDSRLNK